MKRLGLPYPTNIGNIYGGGWNGSVIDRITFEV